LSHVKWVTCHNGIVCPQVADGEDLQTWRVAVSISVYKIYIVWFGDINSKQFKFMLLDGSHGLHISESTVSISYTFRY